MARKRKTNGKPVVNSTPILIVEDERDHALFIREVLAATRIPLQVHVVGSGEEAIDYLAGTETYADRSTYPLPALMLLDLRMPGIGGFGVLRWLCAHPQLKENLNLAVLSAVHSERDIEVVFELGAQHFWLKSDLQVLQDRIRYWHAACLGKAQRPHRVRAERGRTPAVYPPQLATLIGQQLN